MCTRAIPKENANEVAAEQVKEPLRRLSERGDATLFMFDAGYVPVRLDAKGPKIWSEPSAEHRCEDPGYGSVRVRTWMGASEDAGPPDTWDSTPASHRPRHTGAGDPVAVSDTRAGFAAAFWHSCWNGA